MAFDPDRECKKCHMLEAKSEIPFRSPYGLCNDCHAKFMVYVHKALMKFLKKKGK